MTDKKIQKNKPKQKTGRNLMFVQFTNYLANSFPNGFDELDEHLKKHFGDAEWAYLIHDKDIENGQLIAPHIHIAISFENARSPNRIAEIMRDIPQNVEVFDGRWGKQNMFAYLIHATDKAKQEGKHEYDVNKVIANFDYIKYMNNVKQTASANKLDIDEIEAKIVSGEVIMKDFFSGGKLGNEEATTLFYNKYKRRIETAVDGRYKLQMSTKEAVDLEIIYIQGASGSGKTIIAKEYADRKYGDFFISGSSNDSVQDFMGEPVAIFDDARPSDFNASDWLKMLDPYNNKSSVTSRYYNKYLSVKCIIITTTTPFEEFFVYAKDKGGVDEPVSQFMRRFQAVIKVEPEVDDLGDEYAVGKLYSIVKTNDADSRNVGDSWVDYHHELVREDNVQIKVPIPENNSKKVINDIAKYF